MIQASMRCLGFGAASLLLSIGVPFGIFLFVNLPEPFRSAGLWSISLIPFASLALAMIAWANVFQALHAADGEWNPAGAQLIWGRIISALSVLMSLLLAAFFVCFMLKMFPWQN